jgi:hypothetical protein
MLTESLSAIPRASGPVFMFCAPRLVFGGTKSVRSHFHVLRSQPHFGRYRGRRVPFSCFALPNSFSAIPRASGPVFMFCAHGLIFGGTEGVKSRFLVLRAQARFWRSRDLQVPFSCFALTNSFSEVSRTSGPFFMFCAPELIFGSAKGVRSRFHVLRAQTRYWQYRGRRVQFSCFVLPDSFSTAPWASGPVFMICAPGLVFGATECVESRFHVLRSRTQFRRYRGRRFPFSCFALPDSFLAVPSASGPFFMFCALELVFGDIEGVGSRFHVLRSRSRFLRYRGRRVPFSCFALPKSFSVVLSASGPIFMFCAHKLVIGGTEGVGSRFHVLRA